MSIFANPRIILGTIEDLGLIVIKDFDHRAVYECRVDPWHVAEAAVERQRQSSNRRIMVHSTLGSFARFLSDLLTLSSLRIRFIISRNIGDHQISGPFFLIVSHLSAIYIQQIYHPLCCTVTISFSA